MIHRSSIIQRSTAPDLHKSQSDYDVISSDDCRETNQVTVFETGSKPNLTSETTVKIDPGNSNCIVVRDLYAKVKTYCDRIFFSSLSTQDFVEFTDRAVTEFWNLKPEGWNFALSDRHEIMLEPNKCVYPLPKEFHSLSYVSAGNIITDCMPADQVFEIKDFVKWDTIQSNKYAASYKYEPYSDRCFLYIRMPCLHNYNNNLCESTKALGGSLFVKYYTTAPRITDLDDKICNLPRRWGAEDILVQLIAQYIHAYKGRDYVLKPAFNSLLAKLKKIDAGIISNNPIDSRATTSFTIVR